MNRVNSLLLSFFFLFMLTSVFSADFPQETLPSAEFPQRINGAIYDNVTGLGRSNVQVNLTGNVSGFLYYGLSYEQPSSLSGASWSAGSNITYVDGEYLTLESVNSDVTGYVGSVSTVGTGYTVMDFNITDIAAPKYYSIVSTPFTVRRGMTKIANVSWMDNSGFVSVAVQHNATGAWVNYSVVSGENVSSTLNVNDVGKKIAALINTSNYTRGTTVSWKLFGWDLSVNVNDSFPLQSFVVRNAWPVASVSVSPSFPYANMSLNCSASGSDLDGDNVTLFFDWLVQSVSLGFNGTALGVGNYTQGDNVICRVTPFDGSENGSFKDGTVLIQSYGQINFNEAMSLGWNLISLPVEVT